MTTKLPGRLIVIIFVLTTYLLFTWNALQLITPSQTPHNHYQYLTQAFLLGQLHLPISPAPSLLALADPYDPQQNTDFRLHDASLYKGKYYLYFGTLPVFTFFMPFKLITGAYPPEVYATLFFLFLSFVISFLLLIRIKETYFPFLPETHLLFAGLILGLTNNAPFLLSRPMFYEIAIASTYCFTALALYFLYRCMHYGFRYQDGFLFSLCLACTATGRPHFAFVCFILVLATIVYLIKYAPRQRLVTLVVLLLLPPLCISIALGLYNYLRFDSIWEFGLHYQLTALPIAKTNILDIQNIFSHIIYGVFVYFLNPYAVQLSLPFVHATHTNVLTAFSSTYIWDASAGMLFTAPFVVIIFALPRLLYYHMQPSQYMLLPLCWFLVLCTSIPITVLGFLLILSGATQRFISDFSPYLIFIAIITFWLIETNQAGEVWRIKRFFLITGIISIFIGINLGFNS